MYDPIKMRGQIRKACQRDGCLECAWCGDSIVGSFHPHHALVKSSAVRHPAVDEKVENRVPLHWTCHSEHGQSAEMTVKALDYLCDRLGAKRVARWYISLWNEHGLSVARGTLPACTLYHKCPGCGLVMADSDLFYSNGVCLCYGDGCTWEGALDEFIDFDGASEQEWKEYLELVILPLGACCAA